MSRQRKAFLEVDFDCPECKKKMHMIVHRKRTNPTEPPIYDVNIDVEAVKQQSIPGMEKGTAAETTDGKKAEVKPKL